MASTYKHARIMQDQICNGQEWAEKVNEVIGTILQWDHNEHDLTEAQELLDSIPEAPTPFNWNRR